MLNSTPLYDHGLTGLGQVVGIIDLAVSVKHCSFYDPINPIGYLHRKILAYNAAQGNSTHGTHVAGTVCGDAGAIDNKRGVAYQALMVYNSYPAATDTSVYGRFFLHYTQGACIHTNSWGTDSARAYNGTCVGIDRFSWENDNNLVVFAVSDMQTANNPENAKNCLAVSATGDYPNEGSFCYGGRRPRRTPQARDHARRGATSRRRT